MNLKKFGPGLLVTAAFIGPGTITTASTAGANFGFTLIWALVFSVFATIVLQEMAARLGLITRKGLAEAMRESTDNKVLRGAIVFLIVAAIGFGNSAYEAGNLAGAALAVANVTGSSISTWVVILGVVSAVLLLMGKYKILELVLVLLVVTMSLVFITTALIVIPSLDNLAVFFEPAMPSGASLTVIALIGTTVVPYNLFLQANAVKEKWDTDAPIEQALAESRWDTGLSIGLGGLVTLAIISTAATAFFYTGQAYTADSMATQLEPLLGPAANYVFALGLFAGGLTSALTAPLAASYAVCGAMGWSQAANSVPFKLISLIVLVTGVVVAALGSKPLTAILFAQAANGLLLPIVAIFLLFVMNRSQLLGEYKNGIWANTLGGAVLLVISALGLFKLWQSLTSF